MTCGIYKLDFGDDYYYIGKSINIEDRFKQHCTRLNNGTAAKLLQKAFNEYGTPSYKVVRQCHPDHLDVLEAIYISAYNNSLYCLNSDIPEIVDKNITPFILEVLNTDTHHTLLQMSMFEHLEEIAKLYTQLEKQKERYERKLSLEEAFYKEELTYIKSLPMYEGLYECNEEKFKLQDEIRDLKKELEQEKNKSIWKRIFK